MEPVTHLTRKVWLLDVPFGFQRCDELGPPCTQCSVENDQTSEARWQRWFRVGDRWEHFCKKEGCRLVTDGVRVARLVKDLLESYRDRTLLNSTIAEPGDVNTSDAVTTAA